MANEDPQRTRRIILQGVVGIAIVVLLLLVSVQLAHNSAVVTAIAQFGYGGVFFVAIVSGFSVLVPIPSISFLPLYLESGLLLVPTVLIMVLGMSVGDIVGFVLGNSSRKLAQARRQYDSSGRVIGIIKTFHDRHPMWPLVLLGVYVSFVPAPNEILVIPLAFMGYRLRFLFPIIVVGNLIFNTLVAVGILAVLPQL